MVLIIPFFIVALMVLSVISYSPNSPDNTQKSEYRGFTFVADAENKLWNLDMAGKIYSFHTLPDQVEDINMSSSLNYVKYPEYTFEDRSDDLWTSDPQGSIQFVTQFVRTALIQNGARVVESLPLKYNAKGKTCVDASPSSAVIRFEQSNVTDVLNQNDCIVFRYETTQDLLRAKDAFLYRVLGVITKNASRADYQID